MSRDINKLDPVVAHICRALIKEAAGQGIRLIVTSTLRTAEEQAALYAQGRRPASEVNSLRRIAGMPPIKDAANRTVTWTRHSMHETGRAFDVAVLDLRGRAVWDEKEYEEVGPIGESLGLRWGGRFSQRDLSHFELREVIASVGNHAGIVPAHTGGEPAPAIKEEEEMEKAKAGVRSTEFYVALLGAVLPVLNTHLGLDIPVGSVMGISGVVISYILSRTLLKRG